MTKRHLFEYWHDGHWYALPVTAASKEEAEQIVWAMGRAVYRGELMATVPAYAGPLVRLVVWLRNFWSARHV